MKNRLLILTFCGLLCTAFLAAQETSEGSSDSKSQNEGAFVSAKKIKDSLYYLSYKNTNAVAFLGRDYTILIDGHNAKAAPQTLTTAGRLSLNPVRFLINTHHHQEQTGGNAYFSESGVTIMCHSSTLNNIWSQNNAELFAELKSQKAELASQMKAAGKSELGKKLSGQYNRMTEQIQDMALSYPTMSFGDQFEINLANETITLNSVFNAHSGIDVFAFFKNNNVLASGDLFMNGVYPFIDKDYKGSIDGYLKALNKLIDLCNNDTVIVPAHGSIANKGDLERYKRMIEYTQKGVQMDYLLGKTLEEVLANASITANFEAQGYGRGAVSREDYIRMLYDAAEKRYPRRR